MMKDQSVSPDNHLIPNIHYRDRDDQSLDSLSLEKAISKIQEITTINIRAKRIFKKSRSGSAKIVHHTE